MFCIVGLRTMLLNYILPCVCVALLFSIFSFNLYWIWIKIKLKYWLVKYCFPINMFGIDSSHGIYKALSGRRMNIRPQRSNLIDLLFIFFFFYIFFSGYTHYVLTHTRPWYTCKAPQMQRGVSIRGFSAPPLPNDFLFAGEQPYMCTLFWYTSARAQ